MYELFIANCLLIFFGQNVYAQSMVPILSLDQEEKDLPNDTTSDQLKFLPFIMLIDKSMDPSDFWRETEILSLVRNNEADIDYETCEQRDREKSVVQFPSRRIVRPICKSANELDQSCVKDDYNFDADEFLPVTTRRSSRYEPPSSSDCPLSCRGYQCSSGFVKEEACSTGAFLPDKDQCNCCGKCSAYQQLNDKCAEFKKTVHVVNGSEETEVEEEFLEPGCDDGLVCRHGSCQDIHTVQTVAAGRRRRDGGLSIAKEPCKRELKYFKKKFGRFGHLHYNAPQCTPLWLYAPVQCRRFACYCALEDGTFIEGIKVPRVEVSNMNCDCAREKCRTESQIECDGYGNYKDAVFAFNNEQWATSHAATVGKLRSTRARTGFEAALPTQPLSEIQNK
ncbi:unnamed protein product [Leptidea sinapis]|uniref:Thyroglobulin type-1 domain-containing protein n=1 Tax=Leptidea sinapis TaxID=189913 RepID=A0A5E4Q411_9NEOP|nr:unnamed protein product [Leptidea sinapis]